MPKILHIDDSAANIQLVQKILEREGYTVIATMTGTQGIELAIHEHPDLIILDIDLPDMLGYEVCQLIKAQMSVVIIALTGNTLFGDREKALEAGCDGYLPKPVRRENLLQLLAEFLP